MRSPYYWIPKKYLWMVVIGLVIITIGVAYGLRLQGKPLSTDKLPKGILAIELPWSTERASEVVASWEQEGLLGIAGKQVYYDFLFLVLYPFTLSILCASLAGSVPAKWTIPGMLVSWAVLFSGPLDAIENIAILRMLGGSQKAPVPQIASIAATFKFTLVFAAFGYLATGGLRALIHLMEKKKGGPQLGL